MRALFFPFVVACLMLVAAPAAAQQPTEPRVKVRVVRGKDGKKTYVFGKMVLHGKAHRPHAVLMLHRERDLYRAAVPQKPLTGGIAAALRRSPF